MMTIKQQYKLAYALVKTQHRYNNRPDYIRYFDLALSMGITDNAVRTHAWDSYKEVNLSTPGYEPGEGYRAIVGSNFAHYLLRSVRKEDRQYYFNAQYHRVRYHLAWLDRRAKHLKNA